MNRSERKSSYKVVVTGFGPFQGVPRNESWLAVSGLWNDPLPPEIKLVTRELPVVYDVIKEEIPKLWREESPDVTFAKSQLILSRNLISVQ